MVHLPTGAGKTHIFMEQIHTAASKGKTVLVLVRRRQIVFQTARRITERLLSDKSQDFSGTVGIYMGSKKDHGSCVTVASIDTVIKNLGDGMKPEWYDVIIVDECHDCTGQGYLEVLERVKWYKKYVIGYTATPYRIGRKGHTFWDELVKPITAADLREQGYLTPVSIYCPSKPDLSKVAVTAGEYNQKELEKVMRADKLYGDIFDHYKKHAGWKPGKRPRRTLIFCTTVAHSKELAESFNSKGVTAIHVDADTPQKERDEAIANFRKSREVVLCNVNIFSTGVDIPEVECLVLARPTKSLVLYLQQVGRGLRPSRGKSDCLILDHAGNCLKFGSPYNDFKAQLKDMEKGERVKKEANVAKECKYCGYMLPLSAKACTECGQDVRSSRQIVLDASSELIEYKGDVFTPKEFEKKMKNYKYVLEKELRFPPSLVRYKLEKAYGQRARAVL